MITVCNTPEVYMGPHEKIGLTSVPRHLSPQMIRFSDPVIPKVWPRPHDEAKPDCQLSVTLGNYFLLDVDNEKTLKSIHNASYANKLPKMKEWSKNVRSNNILNSITSWDETNITNRNNLLVKALSENIWAIL